MRAPLAAPGRSGEPGGRYGECLSLSSEDLRFYPNRVLLRGEAAPYTCCVAPENRGPVPLVSARFDSQADAGQVAAIIAAELTRNTAAVGNGRLLAASVRVGGVAIVQYAGM